MGFAGVFAGQKVDLTSKKKLKGSFLNITDSSEILA